MTQLNDNDNLPVMMYLHGFMSGANGAKQRQLQKQFKGRYRVIAPELTADPTDSLAVINEIIAKEKPEIIVGTSLGGYMAGICNSGNAKIIVVNPCTFPYTDLRRWVNQEHTYFCKRLDGVQTYTLTKSVLDHFMRYDFLDEVETKRDRVFALCSTADEILGQSHLRLLSPILSPEYLVIVDNFGHQCSGNGLTHLYDLIEKAIKDKAHE